MNNKNLLKKYLPTSGSRRIAVAVGVAAAISLPVGVAAMSVDDNLAVSASNESPWASPEGRGGPGGNHGESMGYSLPKISEPLTPAELESLVYMREEEKLAHDVYVVLGETWGDEVFTRIASAESQHQDALITLLDGYGVADPMTSTAVGDFDNPDLQALFDDLVEQGSSSALDAYKVGAMIEELDIVDLRGAADGTDQEAIIEVLARLEAGSNNHLRAFDSRIQASGETYEASFLDQEEYDAIAAAAHESGGQGRGGRGHGGGGQGRGN